MRGIVFDRFFESFLSSEGLIHYAIILSRLDSIRLPNKAFLHLGPKRLIDWCIDTLKTISGIRVVLATSDRAIDDPLEKIAKDKGILFDRGETENVAKRVADCIEAFNISDFARINADSPFVRAELLVAGFSHIQEYDFVTNLEPRVYPYGISLEVFNSGFYLREYKNFHKKEYFEHVTPYFYEHIDSFNVLRVNGLLQDLHDVRLTVDTKEDLLFLNSMLNKFPSMHLGTIEGMADAYRRMLRI